MRLLAASACVIVAIFAIFTYSQRDTDAPDVDFLAQEISFHLNNVKISVPAIALTHFRVPPANLDPLPRWRTHAILWGSDREFPTNKYKNALLEMAGGKGMAPDVSRIRLNFGIYGSHGERLISRGICPLLTQKWSQDMCANERAQYGIPEHFNLETEEGLAAYERMSFSGYKKVRGSDLIDEIKPFTTRTKVGCTDDRMYCQAGVKIFDEVYAVWEVSCRGMDVAVCGRASEMQGNAISNFVRTKLMVKD